MLRNKIKITAISILAAVMVSIVGLSALDLWKQHKSEKKFAKAMALHNSIDPTERRLSLVLLSQLPVTDEILRLIGARLFDEVLPNQIYAAQCLEAIARHHATMPNSAPGQGAQIIARPAMNDSKRMTHQRYSYDQLEKHIGAWKTWYRESYPL